MISIIGNGLVGLLTARLCEIKSWQYQLYGQKISLPNKLLLLTPNSMAFLHSLGISPPIHNQYAKLNILVKNNPLHTSINSRDYRSPYLCCAVWSNDLLSALSTNISVCYDPIIKGYTKNNTITLLTDKKEYTSDLLIGCDGQYSLSQSIAKITRKTKNPYHCLLIPANISGEYLIQHHANRFILAALPDKNGMIIVSSPHNLSDCQISLASLQNILGNCCKIHSHQQPILITLTPSIANQCYKDNVVLLGNAAVCIEPVTAKGLNHTILNLQQLFKLNHLDPQRLQTATTKMHQANLQLFNRTRAITSQNTFFRTLKHLGLCSQLFSPLLQDALYAFGNNHE